MRLAGYVARMGRQEMYVRFLVGKSEGKRQLGKPKGLWRNNIKMNLKGIDLGAWTGLIWLRTETIDSLI